MGQLIKVGVCSIETSGERLLSGSALRPFCSLEKPIHSKERPSPVCSLEHRFSCINHTIVYIICKSEVDRDSYRCCPTARRIGSSFSFLLRRSKASFLPSWTEDLSLFPLVLIHPHGGGWGLRCSRKYNIDLRCRSHHFSPPLASVASLLHLL